MATKLNACDYAGKCTATAILIFEIVSGQRIPNDRPYEDQDIGALYEPGFVGVTYINLEGGDEGHRLAVVHFKGHHRILQSNDLSNPPNKAFTLDEFLSDGSSYLVEGHSPLILDWMTTDEYAAWLVAIRMCRYNPSQAAYLTGVQVAARNIYVYSAPQKV